jgi:hypothetical protein
MQTLVVGLQANQTLTRLLFHPATKFPSCDTNFSNFLQSTVDQPLGLRELSYGGSIDSLAKAMVRTARQSQNLSACAFASALQELWLSMPNIAATMSLIFSYEIHVTRLNLPALDYASCLALCHCAPSLVHLYDLNIELVGHEAKQLLPEFIKSVKKNGCL